MEPTTPTTHGRMKLSELWEICEETRDSDKDLGAVHCPECQVVSFCHPGDYLCIVCRDEGERSEESRRLMAVHDSEDPDSLVFPP